MTTAAVAGPMPNRAEEAIRQSLEKKADFDFSETPLTDVVVRLKEITGVELQLDKMRIEDAGKAIDAPVTFHAKGITVHSAMVLILRNFEFAWLIKNEVLLITTQEEAEASLITRVYPVHDLVLTKTSYRFDGMYIPGLNGFPAAPAVSSGGGGTGGGGMGGSASGTMGGMGGGMGMFSMAGQQQADANASSVSPQQPSTEEKDKKENPTSQPRRQRSPKADLTFTMDDLIDVIASTVLPTSWQEVGGPCPKPQPLAGMLVISQTELGHEKVEEMFEYLRASSPGLQVVTVRATWLMLDLNQLNQLLHSKTGGGAGIDADALQAMANQAKGYLGTITCFSGQTVHIASGRSRSAVIGAIPVVGGEVGYQPINSHPQSGAVLQVTPQLLPNSHAVLLDVLSTVTHLEGPAETIPFLTKDGAGDKQDIERTLTLDRVKIVAGQLATTLKVPLGEPTLVGGLTSEPATDDDSSAAAVPQLYLFIEATAK